MQTRDMTLGDLLYRLIEGRDPPWNNDASKSTMRPMSEVSRRPERFIEWIHALNPLKIQFCRCGHLREIGWSHGYMYQILYPKEPFTVGLCDACGTLSRMEASLIQVAERQAMNAELERFRAAPSPTDKQSVVIEVELGPWHAGQPVCGIDQPTRLWYSEAGAPSPEDVAEYAARVWPPVEWRPGGWYWQVHAWPAKTGFWVEGSAETLELAKEGADEALGRIIAWMTSGGARSRYNAQKEILEAQKGLS
jgi:hypothetical protein